MTLVAALNCYFAFWWCRYSDEVTYGELFLQNEYEMSCYNLDEADVAEQRKRFNLYEAEVSRRLQAPGIGCARNWFIEPPLKTGGSTSQLPGLVTLRAT